MSISLGVGSGTQKAYNKTQQMQLLNKYLHYNYLLIPLKNTDQRISFNRQETDAIISRKTKQIEQETMPYGLVYMKISIIIRIVL